MKFWDTLATLDRVQHSRAFKIAATATVLLAAIGVLIFYSVRQQARADELRLSDAPAAVAPAPGAAGETADPTAAARQVTTDQAQAQIRKQAETSRRLLADFSAARLSIAAVAAGTLGASLVLLAIVWLGAGLTALGLGSLAAVVVVPLARSNAPEAQRAAVFIGGSLLLAASFSALIEALRASLSASHPVTAIARNVVAQSVRMRISLIFMVLLVLLLASLPNLLDPDTPLRYRVQTFLQFSAGATYVFTAILVLFLSVASVAFEQRDKVIWQTMTKPVQAWQYILGKWLGVVGVAAVVLGVSSLGIFSFTEYLRQTTADGEVDPFVGKGGPGDISEDRLILESQILVGRQSVIPILPAPESAAIDAAVARRVAEAERRREADPIANDPPDVVKITREVESEILQDFLSIEPGNWQLYTFPDLGPAKARGTPVTLRYRVNAGGNLPTELYNLTFYVQGSVPFVRQVHLAQTIAMPVSTDAIGEDGELVLNVGNGDAVRGVENAETISFPPDGLEVSYAVSGFRSNFARAVLVLWVKLAFLSIVAIAAGTFLSFPVACLVAFGLFMCAEGASFLSTSLESYSAEDSQTNELIWHRIPIRAIALPIAMGFKFFSDLAPIESVVEGRHLAWGRVSRGLAIVGALSALVFIVATVIFRRRELATYSGQ